MADEILMQANDVTIRFGGLTAVCEFNLTMRPHELVGLIGPNGAGKTTIFNMLTGVYKPTEGEIHIGGVKTTEMKPFQITSLGVARTFQNIRLFKELTALDNVKRRRNKPKRCSTSSASARASTTTRRTFLTAINEGWRSPGHWPPGRSSCCSTNRPRVSTTARPVR